MSKVGIMGGTFNPIHIVHLMLAQQAYEQYQLDKVLFMPTKNPPHKRKQDIASDEHRKHMILQAIHDNPAFELSTLEMEREGITYTAETLRILKKQSPQDELYFIVGGDSLMDIYQWNEPAVIFQLSRVVAASRDGYTSEEFKNQCKKIQEQYHSTVLELNIPDMAISSRFIRDKIENKEAFRYYVPEEVFAYIQKNHLYE